MSAVYYKAPSHSESRDGAIHVKTYLRNDLCGCGSGLKVKKCKCGKTKSYYYLRRKEETE